MRAVGLLLVTGLVFGLAAAWVPSLGPVWNERPPDQLVLIADRRGAWVLSSALFAIGLVVALWGMLALGGRLVRVGADTAGWIVIGSFVVGTALWLVHLAYLMTVMVSVAEDMARGRPMPECSCRRGTCSTGCWSPT